MGGLVLTRVCHHGRRQEIEKGHRVHQLAHPACDEVGQGDAWLQADAQALRSSKSKLVIISNNCPPLRKSEIEYYAMPAKCSVVHYTGSNVDLGTACGKYYRCAVLSVTDVGDSDIVRTQEGGE